MSISPPYPKACIAQFPKDSALITQSVRSRNLQTYRLSGRRLLIVSRDIAHVLNTHAMQLRSCQVKCSTHTLVLADPSAKVVLRIALTNIGRAYLKANSIALQHAIVPWVPSLIDASGLSADHPWTTEEYIAGDPVGASDADKYQHDSIDSLSTWYSKEKIVEVAHLPMISMLDELVSQGGQDNIRLLYNRYVSQVRKHTGSLKICQIHGDLTHENIRIKDGKLYCFDLERSHVGCAEFDMWLYHLFAQARLEGWNHVDLFRDICRKDLISMRNMLDPLYSTVVSLESNSRHMDIMVYCFKAYVGILTLLELNRKDPSRATYLSLVQKEL